MRPLRVALSSCNLHLGSRSNRWPSRITPQCINALELLVARAAGDKYKNQNSKTKKAANVHGGWSGLTSRAQARGTKNREPRSGTGPAIPRCLQRFVRPRHLIHPSSLPAFVRSKAPQHAHHQITHAAEDEELYTIKNELPQSSIFRDKRCEHLKRYNHKYGEWRRPTSRNLADGKKKTCQQATNQRTD